jgi:hypothetical protein
LFATSTKDCGEFMTYALTSPLYKEGAFFLSEKADPVPEAKVFVTQEGRIKVAEDYRKTVSDI